MPLGSFRNRRVLITGGLGFIGSNLAHRLVEAGAQVTIIDSMIPGHGGRWANVEGIEDRIKVNISDVRDEHSMRHLIRSADYLFNLAGQTSHMDSVSDPYTDLDINCRSQLFILEACRRANKAVKVVFASTRQIYGKPEYLPVDERHPQRPVDVNGINKMAGEWYHTVYNDVHGIRSCSLRLTNTYGPRMRIADDRQTFLGFWFRRVLEGEPFDVWGGAQVRDFNYVDDVVDALMLAGLYEQTNGRSYNLGGDEPMSLRELAELLVRVNGGGRFKLMQFPEERLKIDIGSYYADSGLFRAECGWKPGVALKDGIARTLEYYRTRLGEYLS